LQGVCLSAGDQPFTEYELQGVMVIVGALTLSELTVQLPLKAWLVALRVPPTEPELAQLTLMVLGPQLVDGRLEMV